MLERTRLTIVANGLVRDDPIATKENGSSLNAS